MTTSFEVGFTLNCDKCGEVLYAIQDGCDENGCPYFDVEGCDRCAGRIATEAVEDGMDKEKKDSYDQGYSDGFKVGYREGCESGEPV